MAGVPCPIVASTLPMLRRRRAAVFAGGMAVRLLERAVGIAERVGEAIIVVERAWATRHEIAAAFGSRRTANVTLTEAHTTPENVHESSSAPEHPPVAAPRAARTEVSVAWILARHLATTVERRARVLEEDPWVAGADRIQSVRQIRVASRRLRAFVELFGTDLPPKLARRTRRSLRAIGRALGPLRELDVHVQMLDMSRIRATTPARKVALEHVLEQVERRRDRAETRARKTLAELDRARVMTDLRELTDRVVGPLVRADLDVAAWARSRLGARLEQAFTRMPETPPTAESGLEALHDLRIAAKRMRYAVELVLPALGESDARRRKRLRRVQRALGEHRDLTLFHDLLHGVQAKLRARGREALAETLGEVADVIDAGRATSRERVPAALAELAALRQEVLGLHGPDPTGES